MSRQRVAVLMAGAALFAASARGQEVLEAPGALVGLSVQVEGRAASLYPAADGSGRYYLEARAGSRYALTLVNRTGERVGVVLTVDGLNAISGERDAARGRMYVLDPWQSTSVQGWRTSLQDVRQFTFIDERRSYAARTGQANEKMGWIEVAVYRERRPYVRALPAPTAEPPRPYPIEEQDGNRARAEAPAASAQAPAKDTAEGGRPRRGQGAVLSRHRLGRSRARPGRAGELRSRERALRARDAALRVSLRARRARHPAPARAARSPVAARARGAGLRSGAPLVGVAGFTPAKRAGGSGGTRRSAPPAHFSA